LKGAAVVGTFRRVDLYLMRHGEAGDSPRGDPFRPLTARGRVQASTSAAGLHRRGARPSSLWHSPYVRAAETAALVGQVLGVSPQQDDRFVPDADPDVAARALWEAAAAAGPRARRGGGGLLVVAHLPILPGIVHALGAGRAQFSTAAVVHVVLADGAAVVAGAWTSEQLGLAEHTP
jgi:phosphohistidine phosphatase SixA